LKQAAQHFYGAFWGGGQADPKLLAVADTIETSHAVAAFLASLNPTTEAQKHAVASANTLAGQIDHGRILANLQLVSHPVTPGW
jgi:hypothetical protein